MTDFDAIASGDGMTPAGGRTPRIFIVAGESSGDALGAALMQGLRARLGAVDFVGVGGPAMTAAGLASLFPMSDIAVMGIGPVLARLPTIFNRIKITREAALAARPDALVLIDSPDFCHRIAAPVRAAMPDLPIVLYVSPTVWAWRPGRAKKIAAFTDRLLALLPFEPAAHAVLGGPPTTYVGHPFIEKRDLVRPATPRTAPLGAGRRPRIVVLPGSRTGEIRRLMTPFGAALGLLRDRIGPFDLVLPAVAHVRPAIEAAVAGWPVAPTLVAGEAAKFEAFRTADAALAASGTVTLELALAGLPTVAAYKLDALGRVVKRFLDIPEPVRPLLKVRSAILPNLIVGEKAVPEFIDEDCTPENLAGALAALLRDSPERRAQIDAFARLEAVMALPDGRSPSDVAAEVVVATMAQRRNLLPKP
jgi:lipid-A-disaccharide synthase